MIELFLTFIDWVHNNISWQEWFIIGMVCIALEIFVPGLFFLWIGLAAIFVSLSSYFLDISPETALLMFSICAICWSYLGYVLIKKKSKPNVNETLNKRSEQLVGYEFVLANDIIDGKGRETIQGVSWIIISDNYKHGTRVRVTSIDGNYVYIQRTL